MLHRQSTANPFGAFRAPQNVAWPAWLGSPSYSFTTQRDSCGVCMQVTVDELWMLFDRENLLQVTLAAQLEPVLTLYCLQTAPKAKHRSDKHKPDTGFLKPV